MIIILLLSIIGIILLVNEIKRVHISESPLLTMCGIIIYIYIFALAGFLNFAMYSILALGIFAFIYVLFANRKNLIDYLKSLLEPGFIIFVLLLVPLYFICKPIVTGAWDEYSHWAVIVRYMYIKGALPVARDSISYISYPLGASFIQLLFLRISGGIEGMMYYGQAILLTSCLSAILKGQKFKKPFALALTIVLPIIVMIKFSTHNIFNIFSDTTMAIVAISAFVMYYTSEKKFSDILKIMPVLFALCIIRINALTFAGTVLLLILADQIAINGFKNKDTWKNSMWLFAPIILSFGSWNLHLKTLDVQSVKTAIFPLDIERIKSTLTNFIDAIFKTPLGNVNPNVPLIDIYDTMNTAIFLVFLASIVFIFMQFIISKSKLIKKSYNYVSIAFFISWILYSAGLLLAYSFQFSYEEGVIVASYSRYMATFFMFWVIGVFIMLITIFAEQNFEKKFPRIFIGFLCAALIGLLILISNKTNLQILEGRRLENLYVEGSIADATEIHDAIGWDASVYLVYQKSRGYTFMGTRYQLGTNRANLGTWSMGEAYSDDDTWTVYRDAEKFLWVLREIDYDYVFLGYVDEQFWDLYGELFDEVDTDCRIYKVTDDEDKPLKAVNKK